VHAFPGHGQMKPEQLEIERLRREVQKLKAERDILKNCPEPLRACAGQKQPCAILRGWEGGGRQLIGGYSPR